MPLLLVIAARFSFCQHGNCSLFSSCYGWYARLCTDWAGFDVRVTTEDRYFIIKWGICLLNERRHPEVGCPTYKITVQLLIFYSFKFMSVFMSSSHNNVGEGIVFLGCPSTTFVSSFICPFLRPDRFCYHDITCRAWAISKQGE